MSRGMKMRGHAEQLLHLLDVDGLWTVEVANLWSHWHPYMKIILSSSLVIKCHFKRLNVKTKHTVNWWKTRPISICKKLLQDMDMSQNEVSVFGSKMVTLREKTDTSFWDIPTCFGVDLGTRVVQVDKNIHLQWLKFKQSFFSDFDIWGPDMISVWKLVSTTSLKFCLWGPHHVPQCHVVWIQLDPRVNQRFGQGEEPQSTHRIKTIKRLGLDGAGKLESTFFQNKPLTLISGYEHLTTLWHGTLHFWLCPQFGTSLRWWVLSGLSEPWVPDCKDPSNADP